MLNHIKYIVLIIYIFIHNDITIYCIAIYFVTNTKDYNIFIFQQHKDFLLFYDYDAHKLCLVYHTYVG